MSTTSISYRRGWTVVLAGTAINLALGVLYAWSIFKGAIIDSIKAGGEGAFTWNLASVNDPYALACLVFAFSMIIAGRMQDKIGPRATCIIGGLLVAGGFVVASLSNNYWMWILGFGEGIEVLAPDHLREAIASKLQAAAARYASPRARHRKK